VVVVKDQFAAGELIQANSVLELASQLALVVCPSVVGVLAATGSIRLALLADALTFAVSLLSLAVVGRNRARPARRRAAGGWRGMGQDFRAGVRYLLSARPAAWISEIRLVVVAIAAAGVAISAMSTAATAPVLAGVNAAYTWALVLASLVNRIQRQRLVPQEMLGRVTSAVRVLFLAVDPLGVMIAGSVAAALGGDPRPVFLGAGVMIVVTAAAGWVAGLRAAAVRPDQRGYATGGEPAGA
jgi:hypothetical protein